MASSSSAPIVARLAGWTWIKPRRRWTAFVRLFCASSSSRNAYGRALIISCARTDGSVVSRQWTRIWPASMRSSNSCTPSMSSASCSVSSIVWRTSTWSGTSIGPTMLSWHAAAWGQTERQHDGVIGGCRLQLEVERAAEFFAQRQSQAAVDPRAEGAMDDELHAARVIEEALQHQVLLTGHDAQRGPADGQVIDDHG